MSSKKHWFFGSSVFVAVAFTWLSHEFAHWLVASLLGYEAAMSLNSVSLISGEYQTTLDRMLVRAAGPVFTLLQAAVAFLILRGGSRRWVFPFLFVPFYMRALAAGMNLINVNDEGAISRALHLGTFTLPVLVTLLLLSLVVLAARAQSMSPRLLGGTIFGVMVFSSILILADQFLHLRLL